MRRPVALHYLILAVLPQVVLLYAHDKGALLRGADRVPMSAQAAGAVMLQPESEPTQPPLLDYVIPVKELDCVVRATLQSVHRHSSAKRVLLVAPSKTCEAWLAEPRSDAYPEVVCVSEDTVVPGLSYASLKAFFTEKYGQEESEKLFGFGNHDLSGWYLQQFLKMGVAQAAGRLNLTKDYVVWDSDMVLVHNFAPFNERGQVHLMSDGNVGHQGCNARYEASFQNLTNLSYSYSQEKGEGFTSHHMVVHNDYMLGLLGKFGSSGQHWTKAILEAACPSLKMCTCSFSEYGAYASWLKHKHPDFVAEVPKGYQRLIANRGACCPQDWPHLENQSSSVVFVGFEREGC